MLHRIHTVRISMKVLKESSIKYLYAPFETSPLHHFPIVFGKGVNEGNLK